MVAGEDDDQSRRGHLEGVDVLEHRVGGAEIPTLVNALLRRKDVEELAEVATEIAVPTEHQVPVEAHVECRHVIPDRFFLDWRAIRLMGKPAGGLVGHGRVVFQQRLVRGFDYGAGHRKRPSRHQPVGVRRGIDGVKQFGTAPQS